MSLGRVVILDFPNWGGYLR